MTIDWNWFFAAFAQSAAALIAIIGAFIISKLLGESEKKEENVNKVEELIIQYYDLKKRISSRYFDWYDKQKIKYSSILADAIKNGEFDNLNNDERLNKLYKILPDIFGTDICLSALNERIEELTDENPLLIATNIPPSNLYNNLSEEKEIINSLQIESETLIEKFKKVKNNLSVISKNLIAIRITIWILMIGVIITIIYPLHFIPLRTNQIPNIDFSFTLFFQLLFSLKGILLFLLTLVIEGIFGYFLFLIMRIEKDYNQIKNKLKSEYFEIKSYSKYFKQK